MILRHAHPRERKCIILVLKRTPGDPDQDAIVIFLPGGSTIRVVTLESRLGGSIVRVGVEASDEIVIMREELLVERDRVGGGGVVLRPPPGMPGAGGGNGNGNGKGNWGRGQR